MASRMFKTGVRTETTIFPQVSPSPLYITFGDMIPCPWRFSTVTSFGALPTRQGQGIVSPLHLKVIYGQQFSGLTFP